MSPSSSTRKHAGNSSSPHCTSRPRVLASDGASPWPCVMRSIGFRNSRYYARPSKTTSVVAGFSVSPTASCTAPSRSAWRSWRSCICTGNPDTGSRAPGRADTTTPRGALPSCLNGVLGAVWRRRARSVRDNTFLTGRLYWLDIRGVGLCRADESSLFPRGFTILPPSCLPAGEGRTLPLPCLP